MTDEIEIIPPCRVLFQDGKLVDLVITERLRRVERFNNIQLEPSPKTVYLPHLAQSTGRPKVGRPRVANPKHQPTKRPGTGKGGRFERVTESAILELQSQGLTATQIGERLECSSDLVFKRLRELRNSGDAEAAEDLRLRTCACGRRKIATRPICTRCTWNAHRRKKPQDIRVIPYTNCVAVGAE